MTKQYGACLSSILLLCFVHDAIHRNFAASNSLNTTNRPNSFTPLPSHNNPWPRLVCHTIARLPEMPQ